MWWLSASSCLFPVYTLVGCFVHGAFRAWHRCVDLLLGGLMAVDIAPRTASGAALGVVGIASYIGAGLQDVMSGVLIEGNKHVVNGVEVYDFTYINWFWIGAALMSVLLALLVWNARNRE